MGAASRAEAAERPVAGAVVFDAVLAALRPMAQESPTAKG